MFTPSHEKPKTRSNLRLLIGKKYFIVKRHIRWLLGKYKFASRSFAMASSYEYHSHKTPLYRQLKDVDMWMQSNKVANLNIAVPKLHMVTIKPGETFSYWRLIGKPTKWKGYKKGMVLKSGTVTAATGGGLCQLSNLIYWMTIHTPLTVTERHRHGYDVFPDSNRTQPFGSGATCFYNYGDLVIENNTTDIFQLQLQITNDYLEGAWMCNHPPEFKYEVYEKEHIMQSQFWGGYTRHNSIYRKKYDQYDNLLDDEFVVENHAIMMYAPFITG